ncbi:Kinesin-like calmodulin binding protein, partial [Zea mays]
MFVQLSYVQLQHDYILGNYPVGRDDASQLSALQILVEIGFIDNPESCVEWISLLERFLPRQVAITRAKRDWELDIISRFQLMEHLSKDDARQQFLRILRTLPYGNSVFFSVRKIDDPIGLLPGKIILGINKRGVHFFRPVPKEYLHSAELRDIMQFGSSNTAVFFKMRVAGVLHIFQFETKQGEEICVALQTHINDVMLRRYSKARSGNSVTSQNDVNQAYKPPNIEMFEKRVQELTKTAEDSQKKADQLREDLQLKTKQETEMQEELEGLRDTLQSERQSSKDIKNELDKLKSLCDEKESALQ